MRSSFVLVTAVTAVALTACGDDGTNHLADAPPGIDGTAPQDTAPPDTAGAPVRVTVTQLGAPVSEARVYFLNADSSVVSSTTTDGTGVASATMGPGGSVTVLEPVTNVNNRRLDTFAGVKPGDELHLDLQPLVTEPSSLAFDVVVPTHPTATHYELDTPCGPAVIDPPVLLHGHITPHGVVGSNPSVAVTLLGCPATADLVVVAQDDSFTPLATIYVPAQALANDQTLTVAGPYVDVGTTSFDLSDIPAAARQYSFGKQILGDGEPVFSRGFNLDISVPGQTTTATAALPFPPASQLAGATQVVRTFEALDGAFDSFHHFVDWGPVSDAYAFDIAPQKLPDYTSTPVVDPATQTLGWTQSTAAVQPDFVRGELSILRDQGPAAGEGAWDWSIVAPGSEAGALRFPTLPTDVFDFTIDAISSVSIDTLTTVHLPGGYDAVRAHAFDFSLEQSPPAGTTGHLVAADYDSGGLRIARHRRAAAGVSSPDALHPVRPDARAPRRVR